MEQGITRVGGGCTLDGLLVSLFVGLLVGLFVGLQVVELCGVNALR
jgi:hypothetical protein